MMNLKIKTSFLILTLAMAIFMSSLAQAIDFKIGKDDHYSTPPMKKFYRKNKMEFKATFNDTAIYTLGNTADQQDTNKLFGFADCGDTHSENSARFGWRWWNNELQIMAFTHKNGKFDYKFISAAQIGRQMNYSIELSSDYSHYIFNFNGETIEMDRGCTAQSVKGYILQPYFGGNFAAPHDISIKIDFNDNYADFSFGTTYPNPAKDNIIFIDMYVEKEMDIGFYVYDMMGRLVDQIASRSFSGEQEHNQVQLNLNPSLSSGVYLVYPYATIDGEIKPGAYSGKGDAVKMIILK